MKKLLTLCACALVLGLMAGPANAQLSYCKDILEDGNLNHRCVVIGGIMEEECRDAILDFFDDIR